MYKVGNRVYFQPRDYVLSAINDVMELQKGKETASDIANGKISFAVRMYYSEWEVQFTVTEDAGANRCIVEIGIDGDVGNKDDRILREYALLDSMLAVSTKMELLEDRA